MHYVNFKGVGFMLDKSTLTKDVEEVAPEVRAVSDKIFAWAELGSQEVKSSNLLMNTLKQAGFEVTGGLKVPDDLLPDGLARTAFKAEMQGKGQGPNVVIMLEYDALPIGHACGHNLIAASGLVAALALARHMNELPGRLTVMGTPHEEGGSNGAGKIALLEGGHFEGSDAVLITHPDDRFCLDQRTLSSRMCDFWYHGVTSHAAMAPELGVNALNAARLAMDAVDMLRQHLHDDVRVHGIIPQGGERTNVTPDKVLLQFQVRALSTARMLSTYEKVVNCAKAGELATGARLEFTPPRTYLKSSIPVPEYIELVERALLDAGAPQNIIMQGKSFGSSDLGNVGNEYPTINLNFPIGPAGIAPHTAEFREAANSDEGFDGAMLAGKALALSAFEMLTSPEIVQQIKATFAKAKAEQS
jgi:amidohydrolase